MVEIVGIFFGEYGTPISERAMAPSSDFSIYNKYVVKKLLPVQKGVIASWFDQPGGGIQYKLEDNFVEYISGELRPFEKIIDGLIRMGYLEVQ